jgi:hypothetical protein
LRFDEVVSGAKLMRMPGRPFGRCAIASRRQVVASNPECRRVTAADFELARQNEIALRLQRQRAARIDTAAYSV